MKKSLLIIMFISIVITTFAQRKIKKSEINEEGFSVNMVLEPITDEILSNGVIYKITPISPDELNSLFLKENKLNGKFSYSYYDTDLKSYLLKNKTKKREKSDFEFLMEGAYWLFSNDIIDQAEYDELDKKINFNFDSNESRIENELNSRVLGNPYYFNNRYLSVFKIEIENTTKERILFEKDLLVSTGGNSFIPLSSNFITKQLERCGLMNTEKACSLERNNMSSSFDIPANSKIVKYFSILPIDYDNDNVKISFSDIEKPFEWKIIKEETIINKTHIFYNFQTYWSYLAGIYSQSGENFNLIKSNSSFVYLINTDILIEEGNLANDFEIFTLSLFNGDLYYGRTSGLKGISYLNKEKNKRECIYLKMEKIKELKKKVKQ